MIIAAQYGSHFQAEVKTPVFLEQLLKPKSHYRHFSSKTIDLIKFPQIRSIHGLLVKMFYLAIHEIMRTKFQNRSKSGFL